MSKKTILIFAIIALAISSVSIYISETAPKILTREIEELDTEVKKINREISLLNKRTAPYIYTGESQGYIIDFRNGVRFYFTGDTGLSADLELMGDYYNPNVVFLPIGNIYTLDSETAAYAASLINPSDYIIPTHYGSFSELEESADDFLQELKKYNLKASPLEFKPGEQKEVMGIKVEWLGHNHWLLESPEGTRILIDPAVNYNPSFPQKYQQLIQLNEIDLILITNGHFDSMVLSDIRKWGQLFDPIFITPYEVGVWLKSYFPIYKIIPVDKGAKITKDELKKMALNDEDLEKTDGLIIRVVPASHSSSATPE